MRSSQQKTVKRNKFRLRQGDEVVVTTGRSKGHQGKIMKIFSEKERLLVEGANLVKKHLRRTQKSEGRIIEKEAPIHVSNVAILNPKTNKADKIKYKVLADGKKVRCFKSDDEQIES